jgi:N-acyl-D-amino-acid deacylase
VAVCCRWALLYVPLALACDGARSPTSNLGVLDLVFEHGRVIDGTGKAGFVGDVGIRGDRIVAVGDLAHSEARRRIDVHGHVICPGFIDMLGQSEWSVLVDNRVASKIYQGIVTEFTGEGLSVAPLSEPMRAETEERFGRRYGVPIDWTNLSGYFDRLASTRSTVNVGSYVGATSVRRAVLGDENVQPDAAQLDAMRHLVDEAMVQGAMGLSTALGYAPASYAHTEELIALATVAGRYHGRYATHLRDQGDEILESVDEAVRIGREAHVPVEIFHLKVMGKNNRGKIRQVLQRIEQARASGVDIAADVYPYTALANGLDVYLPPWALEGGINALIDRINDRDVRALVAQETSTRRFSSYDPETILLVQTTNPTLGKWIGRRLSEVAVERGVSPEDALMDLIVEDKGETIVAQFAIDDDDLVLALKQPWVSVGSDYAASAIDGPLASTVGHPRAYGTMARVLGRYVRELGVLPLEEAVRKMTSLPAARMGQHERGILRAGAFADVVVFDPKTIRDVATYQEPAHYAEGVEWVLVNGQVVLDRGVITQARPGRVLRP